MKNVLLALLLLGTIPAVSQNWVYNLNLGIRKTFDTGKKSTLDCRQQFQFTPEIEKYDNEYGDFFNEDGFWAIPDRYLDDDDRDDMDDDDDNDDDDGDDDDIPSGAGNGVPSNGTELNDTPTEITLEWRSTSSLQYNYQFVRWLRANTGYALMYNGDEFRHTFRAELDYRPLRHWKGKRKFDLSARTLVQRIGNPDDGVMEWETLLTPRVDAIWSFAQNHTFTLSNALNGGWDDRVFEFDRWRVTATLGYVFRKIHRFSLNYQYQKRIGRKNPSQGLGLGYEVRF